MVKMIYTNGLAFGLSDRMARELADVGVVIPRQTRQPKETPAPYVAWKPTPGDQEPPF